jgi:phosphoglycerate kinase
MNKLTLRDLDVKGKRVLVRVDYNVPLKDGRVTDDSRITASLPTLRRLLDGGARVILMSHLGRPKGGPEAKYSLRPVAKHLSGLLGKEVRFADDCVGETAVHLSGELDSGDVLLLENLRFHPEEEANDQAFAAQLARLGDLYINDAFGSAHRAHASTEGVTRYFTQAAAGLLMEQELHYLGLALANPERPFVVILGGAKISGKIDVLTHLLDKVDRILIGGGMTYTFYRAMGLEIGDSLVEPDRIEMAREVLAAAGQVGVEIVLPIDSMVSTAADGSAQVRATESAAIPSGCLGGDIGPGTVKLFREKLADARTVVWNGPLGIFEVPAFAAGTLEIARAVAEVTSRGGVSVVGGGDSVAAIAQAGIPDAAYSHVSTGGGAFLEFLEGKTLPGVAALTGRP